MYIFLVVTGKVWNSGVLKSVPERYRKCSLGNVELVSNIK